MAEGGGITGLMTLFADTNSLEVPDFQRNYSWGEDQVDEFHKDIVFASKNNLDHFLGSLILMKTASDGSAKTFQVIDGQQRLTTIFMYLAILRDKSSALPVHKIPSQGGGATIDVPSKANALIFSDEEHGEVRFKSNSLLKTFMNDYIFRESTNRPSMPKSHKYYSLDLRKAYARISILLDTELEKCQGDEEKLRFIHELIKTFQNRIQVLRITTSSYAESFDIFMTLNSRGLALGPSDLVKSLFMKFSVEGLSPEKTVEKNAEISNIWKEVTDNIGDGDVDQFLRHYLVAKQPEGVRSKSIYRKIEKMVTDGSNSPKETSYALLKEINRKSEIYAQLLKPESIEDPAISENCRMMHPLLDTYRIIMLTILDESIKISLVERRELSRICEILCVRWVLTGGNAQQLEDLFQEVSLSLSEATPNLSNAKMKLLARIPDDAKVSQEFNLDIAKTSLVRSVLFRINKVIGDAGEMILLDPKKMHVEHIAPVAPTEYWKKSLFPDRTDDVTADYSTLVEFWGNKTILDKKINESIGAQPFAEKCDGIKTGNWGGYRDSPLAITRELTNYTEWDTSLIKKRSRWIRSCFLNIWSIEQNLGQVVPFHQWTDEQPL